MTDEMIDMMAGDVRFRRRLDAYAESRLSPDLATTSRMRARVLAHAHRHADLARADAALTIVRPGAAGEQRARRPAAARRTAVSLVGAAALVVTMVGGAAAASQAGGALYDARLFIEQVTLPVEPSERAVAELGRLSQRLAEARASARSGDHDAAAIALAAYERIMSEASADVLAANDPVAAAALETGIGRNVEVLRELIASVPTEAGAAISRAVERAIERSANAIDRVHDVEKPTPAIGGGRQDGDAGGGDNGGGAGNGGSGVDPEATDKPTKTPAPKPAATPRPTNERPEETPKPARTPKPTKDPGQGGGPPGNAPD